MNGLLLKDYYSLKPMIHLYFVMIIFFSAIFVPTGNSLAVYVLIVMIGSMLPMTSISYDSIAHWDRFSLTTPLVRKENVKAKYMLMFLLAIAGVLIASVINILTLVFLPGGGTFGVEIDPVTLVLLMLSMAMFIGSISLPMVYRFGVERAMIVIIIVAFGPLLVIFLLLSLLGLSPLEAGVAALPTISAVVFLICCVGTYLSYLLSCRIYGRKEF